MFPVPSEFVIGEVYFPPLLVAATLGLMAALATTRWLNRRRLSRYFFYPPLIFLALVAIYTVLIGGLLVPF